MKRLLSAVLTSAACALFLQVAQATETPYAGEQSRAIKSLSDSEVAGLLAGQGAGMAKAAELNGYPGPAHTLELKDRLSLTSSQIFASEALMASHKKRARELGAELVQAERNLDVLFAKKLADPDAVEQASRKVGLLQAQLRAEHLVTHLRQTALLSGEQVQRYSILRGYDGAEGKSSQDAIAQPPQQHQHQHQHD